MICGSNGPWAQVSCLSMAICSSDPGDMLRNFRQPRCRDKSRALRFFASICQARRIISRSPGWEIHASPEAGAKSAVIFCGSLRSSWNCAPELREFVPGSSALRQIFWGFRAKPGKNAPPPKILQEAAGNFLRISASGWEICPLNCRHCRQIAMDR